MSRYDRVALFIAFVACIAAWFVSEHVFEKMPHFEDEMAYVWQAQVIAKGRLMLPSPPAPESMLVPFVVDYNGNRFGKYPPGWPVALSLGLALNVRAWVNPALAGLAVWLTYLLGRKLFDARVALLAALLTLSSPLFLLLSGSLLSHSWALFLSLSFALAWLDSVDAARKFPAWLAVSVAGCSLGVLALTRPLTAVGVGLPFFLHGLVLLVQRDKSVRLRVLSVGLLAGSVAALLLLWQFAVTGDPFLNPYTLWWKFDSVGFGPGHGPSPEGHNSIKALLSLILTFRESWRDFFGWENASFVFLLIGILTLGRNGRVWLVASVFPALILVYAAYWASSPAFPRYYYEGLFSLTMVGAVGIIRLAEVVFRKLPAQWMRIVIAVFFVFGFGINLAWTLSVRTWEMGNLNSISRSMLEPFETQRAREMTPALVIVHIEKDWTKYGGLLELQNADLTSPFIFALSRGEAANLALVNFYPDRRVIEYHVNQTDQFDDFP